MKILKKILTIANKKGHKTGDFRLKNLIMKSLFYLYAFYINFLVFTRLYKLNIGLLKPIVYQSQDLSYPITYNNGKGYFNNYYYDLYEFLGHHLPVPLINKNFVNSVPLDLQDDYFDM